MKVVLITKQPKSYRNYSMEKTMNESLVHSWYYNAKINFILRSKLFVVFSVNLVLGRSNTYIFRGEYDHLRQSAHPFPLNIREGLVPSCNQRVKHRYTPSRTEDAVSVGDAEQLECVLENLQLYEGENWRYLKCVSGNKSLSFYRKVQRTCKSRNDQPWLVRIYNRPKSRNDKP